MRGTAITATSPGSGIRGSLAPSVRAGGNSSTAHEGEHPPGACFDRARRARAHQPRSPLPRTRPLTGTCHQRSRSPCQLLTARASKSTTMPRSWVCSKNRIQRSRCLSKPGASEWRSSQFNQVSSIPDQQTLRSGLWLRRWAGISCTNRRTGNALQRVVSGPRAIRLLDAELR